MPSEVLSAPSGDGGWGRREGMEYPQAESESKGSNRTTTRLCVDRNDPMRRPEPGDGYVQVTAQMHLIYVNLRDPVDVYI